MQVVVILIIVAHVYQVLNNVLDILYTLSHLLIFPLYRQGN